MVKVSAALGLLNTALRQQTMVTITRRDHWDVLHGIPLAVGEKLLALTVIDENGADRGVSIVRLADAARISSSENIARARFARPERRQLSDTIVLAIESGITLLLKAYGLVCIHTEGADGGFILVNKELQVTNDYVVVTALDDDGREFESVVTLRDITRLDADGPYERVRMPQRSPPTR